jgi:hypothetical protein
VQRCRPSSSALGECGSPSGDRAGPRHAEVESGRQASAPPRTLAEAVGSPYHASYEVAGKGRQHTCVSSCECTAGGRARGLQPAGSPRAKEARWRRFLVESSVLGPSYSFPEGDSRPGARTDTHELAERRAAAGALAGPSTRGSACPATSRRLASDIAPRPAPSPSTRWGPAGLCGVLLLLTWLGRGRALAAGAAPAGVAALSLDARHVEAWPAARRCGTTPRTQPRLGYAPPTSFCCTRRRWAEQATQAEQAVGQPMLAYAHRARPAASPAGVRTVPAGWCAAPLARWKCGCLGGGWRGRLTQRAAAADRDASFASAERAPTRARRADAPVQRENKLVVSDDAAPLLLMTAHPSASTNVTTALFLRALEAGKVFDAVQRHHATVKSQCCTRRHQRLRQPGQCGFYCVLQLGRRRGLPAGPRGPPVFRQPFQLFMAFISSRFWFGLSTQRALRGGVEMQWHSLSVSPLPRFLPFSLSFYLGRACPVDASLFRGVWQRCAGAGCGRSGRALCQTLDDTRHGTQFDSASAYPNRL